MICQSRIEAHLCAHTFRMFDGKQISQLLFSPYMEPSSAQWIFVSLSLFIRSEYIESMQANEGKDVDLQPGLMYKSPLLCYADAHSTRR
jgi:hypothetical protein